MKVFKFRGGLINSPYAYIKCWPWEKFAIIRKMKKRKTGLVKVTWQPGPRYWGASFMIATVFRRVNLLGEYSHDNP